MLYFFYFSWDELIKYNLFRHVFEACKSTTEPWNKVTVPHGLVSTYAIPSGKFCFPRRLTKSKINRKIKKKTLKIHDVDFDFETF